MMSGKNVETVRTTKAAKTKPAATPADPSLKLALICAEAVIDKKAEHSIILNVGAVGSFADYFLIASGNNERQVQAMADEAVSRLKAAGEMPRIEGYDTGRWVLVDSGSVVLHLFHEDIRNFYQLEELWAGAPRVAIPAEYYTGPATRQ